MDIISIQVNDNNIMLMFKSERYIIVNMMDYHVLLLFGYITTAC